MGLLRAWSAGLLLLALPLAAEEPYFVTYSHHLEEPGNLEVAFQNVTGKPPGGNRFVDTLMETEYGVRAWWTTEFYLCGQGTSREGTLFTGYRWENRVRPLAGEHWINPVLYVEFENLNGADKSLKEVVGFDSAADQAEPNAESSREREREIETKLILSSDYKGWNISENLIGEKNLGHEPWEFGYAIGISRPLALAASARDCRLCRENFRAGLELYGGLGTWSDFGLRGTSHYLAPTLAWQMANGVTLQVSPGFGLTGPSHAFLLRFAVAYEMPGIGRLFRRQAREAR